MLTNFWLYWKAPTFCVLCFVLYHTNKILSISNASINKKHFFSSLIYVCWKECEILWMLNMYGNGKPTCQQLFVIQCLKLPQSKSIWIIWRTVEWTQQLISTANGNSMEMQICVKNRVCPPKTIRIYAWLQLYNVISCSFAFFVKIYFHFHTVDVSSPWHRIVDTARLVECFRTVILQ